MVSRQCSGAGAGWLRQPDWRDDFQRKPASMPELHVSLLGQLQDSLTEVKPLIDSDGPITPAAVQKINEITTRLDSGIVTRNP